MNKELENLISECLSEIMKDLKIKFIRLEERLFIVMISDTFVSLLGSLDRPALVLDYLKKNLGEEKTQQIADVYAFTWEEI